MRQPEVNPEREQDRARDLYCLWKHHGYTMFPQQRAIYWQLAERLGGKTVLEAGCGAGTGTAILGRRARGRVIGTDKLEKNVCFAKALYPWVEFAVWDVTQPPRWQVEAVAAVEVIEHVADAAVAIRNLLDAATEEVWISTPNGTGKPRPPENPYHVLEYTPLEVLALVEAARPGARVEILSWETFEPVGFDTDTNPLVYRVVL